MDVVVVVVLTPNLQFKSLRLTVPFAVRPLNYLYFFIVIPVQLLLKGSRFIIIIHAGVTFVCCCVSSPLMEML